MKDTLYVHDIERRYRAAHDLDVVIKRFSLLTAHIATPLQLTREL